MTHALDVDFRGLEPLTPDEDHIELGLDGKTLNLHNLATPQDVRLALPDRLVLTLHHDPRHAAVVDPSLDGLVILEFSTVTGFVFRQVEGFEPRSADVFEGLTWRPCEGETQGGKVCLDLGEYCASFCAAAMSAMFETQAATSNDATHEDELRSLIGTFVVEVGLRQARPFVTFNEGATDCARRLFIDAVFHVGERGPVGDDDEHRLLALSELNMRSVTDVSSSAGALRVTLDEGECVFTVEGDNASFTTGAPWWLGPWA